MGLETEALLFESCKLCPEATDSGFQVLQQLFLRGLCLIKTVYKRSHFTKPARVSLTGLADRNNKWGDNNKLRRGERSWKQDFLQARKEKLMGLETEAMLFESCKLCPEARDSGFQVLQQLFF